MDWRSIYKTPALLVLTVACLSPQIYSQLKIPATLIRQDTSSRVDTLGLTGGRLVEAPLSGKSTTLAMLLSAVVPGAGQIYTGRYLHVPVVWGLGYYLGRQWKKGNDLYREYGERYASSVSQDTAQHLGNDQLRFIRDFYHDERDRFGLYIGILYVLNIVDAYVGASLYDFEVSDELGGNTAVKLRFVIR